MYDVSRQSVGFSIESAFGVFTAPTLFIPFEGVGILPSYETDSDAAHVYGATTLRADQIYNRANGGAGPVSGPLPNLGFTDALLQMAMGVRATTTSGVPATYSKETYTFGSTPSATIQTIRPRESSSSPGVTVEDGMTFTGAMVRQFTLGAEVDKPLRFTADMITKDALWELTPTAATTSASTSVTVPSTTHIRAGMKVSGTGIPALATVASVTNSTTFVLSAAATATGTPVLTIGFATATPAYEANAKIFRAAQGMVVLSVDEGGGYVERCFSSFELGVNNQLQADTRFCGKEQPARNSPREISLSLKGGLYDPRWINLVRDSTVVKFKAVLTSTYDPNCKLTVTAPACMVKPMPLAEMSVTALKQVQDVDLVVTDPIAGGSSVTIELVRTPASS